jgi:hypothetical protein
MRKINNLIKMLVLCGGLFFASCETTELDLTVNPNALAPAQADPDFYLNAIQISFAYLTENNGRTAGQLARVDYMSGRDYQNAYSPAGFDGRWSSAYQTIMLDIVELNKIADETGLVHHKAMGQVMQAHILMTLVDFFGDIPYTEAFQGAANLNPVADSGASVYAVAIGLLDDAIANFNADALGEPALDMYYGGDWAAWTKAANTMKMKAYMATRLVDGSAVSKFNTIVASGNYISSNADDMQFRWGTNDIQPDSRHPRYRASYTSTGGGRYMSNSLMDYMRGGFDGGYDIGGGVFIGDPRIMFYFYRQRSATPGIAGEDSDEQRLECGLQSPPAHYGGSHESGGYVFCGNPQGWWGRDHGNDNGIPPDGFYRALAGVYPAGGKLDDWSYGGQQDGAGFGGNGITPIMLASWTDFMIGELELVGGDEAAAKNAMFAGMAKSMNKVTNFYPRTNRFDGIMAFYFGGLDQVINDFYARISDEWDDAADKMNVLGMQYFVAQFGNGLDAYNFYRRTGYPTTLQPNIEADPGGFIRSFFYPANHANTNQNISQKDGVTDPVFWDTNPGSPGFPVAN